MILYMTLANISNFNNIKDYLPILNGCLNADLIVIVLTFHNAFGSKLKKWYTTFQLNAVIADTLILMIGIILARYFYYYIFSEYSIIKFTGLAILIQIIHDLLFAFFFTSLPRGYHYMFDFFKDYAKEVGFKAVLGDSAMMAIACLLSSYLACFSMNINIIGLIVSLYYIPYLLNYERQS